MKTGSDMEVLLISDIEHIEEIESNQTGQSLNKAVNVKKLEAANQ